MRRKAHVRFGGRAEETDRPKGPDRASVRPDHTAAALMIATGAHPEHIKRHLGHSLITVTMDLYGHLFPSEADAIADQLDQMLRESQTDKRRTKPTVSLSREGRKDPLQTPDQGVFEWARQASILQPTDYESAALTRLSYGPEIFNNDRVFGPSPPLLVLPYRS